MLKKKQIKTIKFRVRKILTAIIIISCVKQKFSKYGNIFLRRKTKNV